MPINAAVAKAAGYDDAVHICKASLQAAWSVRSSLSTQRISLTVVLKPAWYRLSITER